MLDLLLINPNSKAKVYQVLSKDLSAIEPPVWAGLMASFVRVKGYSVMILDAEAENLDTTEIAERVSELRPRLTTIVVYGHQPSASTQNMTAAGKTCQAIKDLLPTTPVLLVGGHVSALPERTLTEEKVDFVSSGEGLYTQIALIEALKTPQPNLAKVPDLWYRVDGKVQRSTETALLLQDLNSEMPGIAWDLLPMTRYRAHNWHCFGHLQREPYAAVYTTLGCPYHCTFCCIQAPFKSGEKAIGMQPSVNSYRFWSPKRMVDDFEMLATNYGVRNIKFADEMFVLNPRHVDGICDEIINRKLDFNIWAYARVDTVRNNMLDKLLKAGIRWLAFGVEAANTRVRGNVQKGFDQKDIALTIDKVRQAGIYVIANYIFGLPEDDLQTMQETLALSLDLNAEFANFYCAMAYPGSALYNLALQEDWPLPKNWTGYSQHSVDMLPLPTKYLPASEVIKFRDRAFQTYFNSPKYHAMVQKTFGPDTVAHIHNMASHRLERQFISTN